MNINWTIRWKNPVFIMQVLMAIIMPILAYGGLTVQDLTTWGAVWEMVIGAVSNPYVLGLVVVSVWNAVNDPTTTGLTDSDRALDYVEPNSVK